MLAISLKLMLKIADKAEKKKKSITQISILVLLKQFKNKASLYTHTKNVAEKDTAKRGKFRKPKGDSPFWNTARHIVRPIPLIGFKPIKAKSNSKAAANKMFFEIIKNAAIMAK